VRYQIRLNNLKKRLFNKNPKGVVFVEYLLLVTLVGFGVIVGLATLRSALVNELLDLANAINAINT
jgi:pilus assembly protein Flp/PilA